MYAEKTMKVDDEVENDEFEEHVYILSLVYKNILEHKNKQHATPPCIMVINHI